MRFLRKLKSYPLNKWMVRTFRRFPKYSFSNTILIVAFNQSRIKHPTSLVLIRQPRWESSINRDFYGFFSDLDVQRNEVGQLYLVTSVPQNVLIDPAGKIIAVIYLLAI